MVLLREILKMLKLLSIHNISNIYLIKLVPPASARLQRVPAQLLRASF